MNTTRISLAWQVARMGVLATSVLVAATPVSSATLDGKAMRTLTSDQVWQVTSNRGPGRNYWAWKADGSVCLRVGEKTGKCTDTGHWKIEGDRLCYELSWWGATDGMKSGCVRIAEKGKAAYEALEESGVTRFEFSLAK